MRKKSLICILGLCISMLFAACGEESINLIEIDDNTYNLIADFEDVIEEMSDNDVLVCDMQGYAYDKDGTFSKKISNDDKKTMPLCVTRQKDNSSIFNGDIQGIKVNMYVIYNDFKSIHGITEKSSKSKIKRLDGFQQYLSNGGYFAMYMDNNIIIPEDYEDETYNLLKEHNFEDTTDIYMKEMAYLRAVELEAIDKLQNGKINSFSFIWYQSQLDNNNVNYYICTYDESLENQ